MRDELEMLISGLREKNFEISKLTSGQDDSHSMNLWFIELGKAFEGALQAVHQLADAKRRVDWVDYNSQIAQIYNFIGPTEFVDRFQDMLPEVEETRVQRHVDYYKALQKLRALFMVIQGRSEDDIADVMAEEREYIIALKKAARENDIPRMRAMFDELRKKYPDGKKRPWHL